MEIRLSCFDVFMEWEAERERDFGPNSVVANRSNDRLHSPMLFRCQR